MFETIEHVGAVSARDDEQTRAEQILEVMANAYATLDREFRFITVNPAAERALGKSRDVLRGRTYWEVFPASVDTDAGRAYRRVVAEGVEAHLIQHYVGERYDIHLEIDAYPTADGVAIFWRDITERVRTAAALAASEARFRAVQDSAPHGFGIHRPVRAGGAPDGAVVDFDLSYANAAAARIVGLTMEQIVGRRLLDLFPGTEPMGVFAGYVRAFETGQLSHQELLYQRNGCNVGLEITAVRIADELAVTFADVTDRIVAQAEREKLLHDAETARVEAEAARSTAEAANRAKSEFLAVMSHELRTPLNAIGGYTQLLEMGVYGAISDTQRETLTRIDRAQRHLLRLVNDVLNLARLKEERVAYAVQTVNLAEVVGELDALIAPQLREKGLTYAVDVPADCMVLADRDKLVQVLLNLVSNAVKFTSTGGAVTVECAERTDGSGEPGLVYLRVRDTGEGIAREKLESIFEPFVQVDTSAAGRAAGAGLGLAISRDLARGMGGDLRARSKPGVGSTLTLRLPAGR